MPRGDRTGPGGFGPMTGRGMGVCAGYDRPGFANARPGYGLGMGYRGGGRGWRNMYYATGMPGWARGGFVPPAPVAGSLVEELKAQAGFLAERLEALQRQIAAAEGQDPD